MIYKYDPYQLIAGTDEAGRGSLAGPVVAASVILPKGRYYKKLNDSKLLKADLRESLYKEITATAISWKIVFKSHQVIDSINILNASHEAMYQAALSLEPRPEILLVDGNSFKKDSRIPYECKVNGDAIYAPIAAASILAKVARDRFMAELSRIKKYSVYDWSHNKGYATPAHIEAIKIYGFSDLHRKSFIVKSLQLSLFDRKQ